MTIFLVFFYDLLLSITSLSFLVKYLQFYLNEQPDMGQEDDINASIAHIVLGCVAGQSLGRVHVRSYSHPGMHANFFVHGLLGFLHFQSKIFFY